MRRRPAALALAIAALLAAAAGPSRSAMAGEPEWGPWKGRWAPVGEVLALPPAPPPRKGLLEALYRHWRTKISPVDGANCPFYPTCSAYMILAVRAHGLLLGGIYTLDRLLREYPFMDRADHYPWVTPHEIPRLYDPVPPRRDRKGGRRGRAGD